MHVSTLMQTNQRSTNAGEVYHPTLYTGGNGAALNTVNNVIQLSFLFPHFLSFFLFFIQKNNNSLCSQMCLKQKQQKENKGWTIRRHTRWKEYNFWPMQNQFYSILCRVGKPNVEADHCLNDFFGWSFLAPIFLRELSPYLLSYTMTTESQQWDPQSGATITILAQRHLRWSIRWCYINIYYHMLCFVFGTVLYLVWISEAY